MSVAGFFQRTAEHLVWLRLPDAHDADGRSGRPIEPDQAYFVVRMSEMYLGKSRILWRKFYPMLHSLVTYGAAEQHQVAGPGQLHGLGEAGLDRVVTLNIRLAGPTPFVGGDLGLVAGLYAVAGGDTAKALVDAVSSIAGLAALPVGPVVQVTQVVKAGVENVLGLATTSLKVGVNATFDAESPLRTGYHVGIGADAGQIDPGRLWIRDGRLIEGPDPIAGRPYAEHDYVVIHLQRRERREDWAALPAMPDHQQRFNAVLADRRLTEHAQRAELTTLWPAFREVLQLSPHLTRHDADRIENDVRQNLLSRLAAIHSSDPFESKAWGGSGRSPTDLDFAEVPEYPMPPEPISFES